MFAFMLVPTFLAAPVPAMPEGKAVEHVQYTGHFEKNTSGLKGEVSQLVFADADAFGKVFGQTPPLMGKIKNRSNPVKADSFEKGLVVAAITRGNAVVTYSDIGTKLAGNSLFVSYKATFGPVSSATFASPLILGVPKDGIKHVVFVADGKESNPVEVK
jgi:hypothetical protein